MAKKGNKGPRILIRLNSSAGTGHFYTTSTNTRNNGAKNKTKLEIRKFDPVIRQYVMYKEGKIK